MQANHSKLLVFLRSLAVKPHVIVCTETWNLPYYQLYGIDGYRIYYNKSFKNSADGVVMYIREDLSVADDKIVIIGDVSFLSITLNLTDNQTLTCTGVYRCHKISVAPFNESLKEFLKKDKSKNHKILGDFNIDISRNSVIENNSDSTNFVYNMLECGFLPLFRKITRPNLNDNRTKDGSCIDNIFLKTESRVAIDSYKIMCPFTDHFPLFSTVEFSVEQSKITEPEFRINFKKFSKFCSTFDWTQFQTVPDPNVAMSMVVDKIKYFIMQATFNNKKIARSKPRKPWITPGIVKSIIKKEKLYKAWIKNKNDEHLKMAYKTYEKTLIKAIKYARWVYDTNQIASLGNNTKKIWSYINNKLNRKMQRNRIEKIDVNNKILSDSSEIAENFNNFFTNIGLDLDKAIPASNSGRLPHNSVQNDSLFLFPTCAQEVERMILGMPNKAGGWDGISAKTLKLTSCYISETLANIFNSCMDKGIWPDCLKCADIVPVYKNGNKMHLTNYRPIALISNIAKIFEKIVYNRLYSFLDKNKFFAKNQFGFLKGKNTTDALDRLTNFVYSNVNNNKKVIATFIDLKKAFDTVNYDILLNKMERNGVRELPLKLFRSYLHKRKCKTKVNNVKSTEKDISIGVPQGTLLGPLLFLIYINDIFDNCVLYADDTVVLSVGDTWEIAERNMNESLARYDEWFNLNRLTLNLDKTVFMTMGTYKDSVPVSIGILIRDREIKRVESCKYLGVYIDCYLRWDIHVNFIVNRTKYLLFVFNKLKKVLAVNCLQMIYFALFLSIASYGIIAWGGADFGVISKLQLLQNRLTGFLLTDTVFLNLNQLFVLQATLFHFENLLSMYHKKPKRTRNNQLEIPNVNKSFYKKSSYYIAIKTFNALPADLKEHKTGYNAPKSKLRRWIVENECDEKLWNYFIKGKL